jgi:hypothetical protein
MAKGRQGALKYGLLVGFLSALLFTALGFAGMFVSLETSFTIFSSVTGLTGNGAILLYFWMLITKQ